MHITPMDIDQMQMPELDEVRHAMRISKRQLCVDGGLCPSTYQRWMRHFQGLPGGSAPHPRSVRAVRDVLKRALAEGVRVAVTPGRQVERSAA